MLGPRALLVLALSAGAHGAALAPRPHADLFRPRSARGAVCTVRACADGSEECADAGRWLQGNSGTLELGLLPFPLKEGLLPGETKQVLPPAHCILSAPVLSTCRGAQVHLYEARFLALFERATSRHHGCLGQLLIVPQASDSASCAGDAPLARIGPRLGPPAPLTLMP